VLKQFKYFYSVSVVFSLLFVLPPRLLSQIKYTVLLPTIDKTIPVEDSGFLRIAADNKGAEVKKAFFRFNFNYLPVNAKIDLLKLKLYKLPNTNSSLADFSSQTITVLEGTHQWLESANTLNDPNLNWANSKQNKNKSIGTDEVTKNSTSLNVKLKIPGSLTYPSKFLNSKLLSLAARSPEKGEDNKFYSSLTAATPGNFSKKPKLIVTYEVDPYPFRSDWAQASATAQHNSYLNWATNAVTTSATARLLPNTAKDLIVGADPTGALAVYKNQPIIFTLSRVGKDSVYAVKQLDGNGKVLWSQGVDGIAKCWPLIDEQGRLYYISVKGKLTVLDSNTGNIVVSKQLGYITNGEVTSINNNSTIGYDNTLYLTTDRGIIALSGYPEFKTRWKYENNTNELCGTVSLSPDESKAFFISVNTQMGKSRLMVLDNMDGSRIDYSKYSLGGYKNDLNYYIPAPVVRSNSEVLVLNGYDNSSELLFFNLQKGKLSLKDSINSGTGINTGISQPVIQPVIDNRSNIFFVYNKKMARYDDELKKVEVFNGSSLDNASILVTDRSSNIYALDPYNGANSVFGFRYDNTTKAISGSFNLKLNDVKFDTANSADTSEANRKIGNTRKNLIIAPDQTLYTATLNNVVAVTPLPVNDLKISALNLKTNTVYRASNSIIVTASEVKYSVNTILYSGGTISFMPGFTLQKGAQLSCKTGY
jgi:hypothetical protein